MNKTWKSLNLKFSHFGVESQKTKSATEIKNRLGVDECHGGKQSSPWGREFSFKLDNLVAN